MSGAHSMKRQRTAVSGKVVGWAVVVLVVLGILAFLLVGANGPADPTLGGLPGFGEVAFQVLPAGGDAGTAGQFCALLAETEQQRAKGLTGRTDLAGYDAMVFRFADDTSSGFNTRDVPVALSIAWFGADGRFEAAKDMAPCPDQDGCPTSTSTGPYRLALEVTQGDLARLKVGDGAVLTVGGACPN